MVAMSGGPYRTVAIPPEPARPVPSDTRDGLRPPWAFLACWALSFAFGTAALLFAGHSPGYTAVVGALMYGWTGLLICLVVGRFDRRILVAWLPAMLSGRARDWAMRETRP